MASKASSGALVFRVETNTILPVIWGGQPPQTDDSGKLVHTFRSDVRGGLESKLKHRDDTNQLVTEPLVADLHIYYFGERNGEGVYLAESDRALLHLDLPALHKLAAGNLINTLPRVIHQDPDPIFTINTVGKYEASLLLADTFWEKQASAVRGELIAAVPSPDVLFFTGSALTNGVKQLRAKVQQFYSGNPEAISKALLVRRNGKWEEFKD